MRVSGRVGGDHRLPWWGEGGEAGAGGRLPVEGLPMALRDLQAFRTEGGAVGVSCVCR